MVLELEPLRNPANNLMLEAIASRLEAMAYETVVNKEGGLLSTVYLSDLASRPVSLEVHRVDDRTDDRLDRHGVWMENTRRSWDSWTANDMTRLMGLPGRTADPLTPSQPPQLIGSPDWQSH